MGVHVGDSNCSSCGTYAYALLPCPFAQQILTMDVISPRWVGGKSTWGGKARQDPTEHKLWKQHVEYIQVGCSVVRSVDGVNCMRYYRCYCRLWRCSREAVVQ